MLVIGDLFELFSMYTTRFSVIHKDCEIWGLSMFIALVQSSILDSKESFVFVRSKKQEAFYTLISHEVRYMKVVMKSFLLIILPFWIKSVNIKLNKTFFFA